MNERLSTRSLADILSIQKGLSKERAEKFIDILSSYITQGIENNKSVKILGFGVFKIIRVRERESVHIQTGERFVIPAHHKLSFIPDKNLKEQINRPFALFFEPIEAIENISSQGKQPSDSNETKEKPEIPIVVIPDDEITSEFPEQSATSEYNFSEAEESPSPDTEKPDEETGPKSDYIDVVRYEYEEINTYPENEEEDPIRISSEQGEYENEGVGITIPPEIDEPYIDEDENAEEYALPENFEEYNSPSVNDKKKKRKISLLIWFLLLPFLILAGIALGTYAFLYYNSDKSYRNIISAAENNQATSEADDKETFPLPIGENYASDTDNEADESENSAHQTKLAQTSNENVSPVSPNNTVTEESTTETKNKKEGKPVIDWLAPAPEHTSVKSEPKRADKPNQTIEEKNKKLSDMKQNQQNSGNTAQNASTENMIPARVRMTAGSSLTQIAMEHYGDKVFWVYIYEYNKNQIEDFNNVPVGMEIRLPQPGIYGINAKNEDSIQKARRKQSALLKWDNWDDYK